jgi:integrase
MHPELSMHVIPTGSPAFQSWAGLLSKAGLPFFPSRVPVPRPAAHVGDAAARRGLRAEGVHPKVVQERLGHSQISVTLDTYSHILPSMQVAAARRNA